MGLQPINRSSGHFRHGQCPAQETVRCLVVEVEQQILQISPAAVPWSPVDHTCIICT